MPPKKRDVQREKKNQQQRQHSGVKSEKPRQRLVAIIGSADDQFRQSLIHQPEQVRRHAGGPVSFLVPRQQIAGQRKAQHDLHQNQPEPKIHFPRGPIRPVDHDLHQMQHEQTTIACAVK